MSIYDTIRQDAGARFEGSNNVYMDIGLIYLLRFLRHSSSSISPFAMPAYMLDGIFDIIFME